MKKIGEKTGVSSGSVRRYLLNYQIPIRSPKSKSAKKPSKRKLENLYVVKRSSVHKIALAFNVSDELVRTWLNDYEIGRRTKSEAQSKKYEVEERLEEPLQIYLGRAITDGRTLASISRECAVTRKTIRNWLKEFKFYNGNNTECLETFLEGYIVGEQNEKD